MKRWIIAGLVLVLWTNLALAKQVAHKGVRSQKRSHAQSKKPEVKEDPYKAYIVVEASSGKVLEGENIHLRWPPASITKLMLSLVVLDKLERGDVRLEDRVGVSKEASKMGGSQVFLKEGETFSLDELMKATVIASANDAAYAIGEHIAGTREACVKLMNEKAKELGMMDTEFRSVHGLPPSNGEQEDLTSCHDLAILAGHLLKYPRLLEWTSIRSDFFRDGTLLMNNHNKLLLRMQAVDGLKTGYYRKAGYSIVATAKNGDLRFIVVVMGSPKARTRDDIALEKLKKYLAQYRMLTLIRQGEAVEKEIILTNAERLTIKGVARTTLAYPVHESRKVALRKEINLPEKVEGEIKEGQKLGEIVMRLENEIVGRTDIISPVSIPKAGFVTRLLRTLGFD